MRFIYEFVDYNWHRTVVADYGSVRLGIRYLCKRQGTRRLVLDIRARIKIKQQFRSPVRIRHQKIQLL